MPGNHDARYKRFFSNPILLRQLLESFVSEDFIKELDFSTLHRVDKSFVTEEFRERESDLIHEIRYRDSKKLHFPAYRISEQRRPTDGFALYALHLRIL